MKIFLKITISLLCAGSFVVPAQSEESDTTLWYANPASNWNEAFPLGNGRLAAMNFGGADSLLFQLNEESLWAGSQINPYADNFYQNLKKVQEMILAGDPAEPTSFRSYEPLANLCIEFDRDEDIMKYRRKLDLSTGVCTERYTAGESEFRHESFISAVDDVLCIRVEGSG